jgi:hypothetical protein
MNVKQAAQAVINNGRDLALTVGVMLAPAIAMAQSTDPFDVALGELTTKVTSYGGALVVFSAVSVAFFVAIKYVKKIPRAS